MGVGQYGLGSGLSTEGSWRRGHKGAWHSLTQKDPAQTSRVSGFVLERAEDRNSYAQGRTRFCIQGSLDDELPPPRGLDIVSVFVRSYRSW